jgi:hypothetical protein
MWRAISANYLLNAERFFRVDHHVLNRWKNNIHPPATQGRNHVVSVFIITLILTNVKCAVAKVRIFSNSAQHRPLCKRHIVTVRKSTEPGFIVISICDYSGREGSGFGVQKEDMETYRRWPDSSVREGGENYGSSPCGFPEP